MYTDQNSDQCCHLFISNYNLLFSLSGLLSIIVSILQLIFSVQSQNMIYFISCVPFGLFYSIASIIYIISNCFKNWSTKFKLASWTSKFLTFGFIPFVNTIALHSLYTYECLNADNRNTVNFEQNYGLNLCEHFLFDIIILVLSIINVCLGLVFCIPFNLE